MKTLYDGHGRPITLGAQLGKGGEGTVFEIAHHSQFAAKIYHSSLDKIHSDKLAAMVRTRSERISNLCAWPADTIHMEVGGPIQGFVMPKISGYQPIHKLYGPKTRMAEFPNATWPFLIHTATNLASVFSVLHEHGLVVGDVNHGNVVVSNQATVKFIDCDSFQIVDRGRVYRCQVGVATHIPPELQGLSLQTITRTENHDNFGLAILIFQLLCMARHPYSGAYLGNGEMPLERAIKEFRFAYGRSAAQRLMRQPPGSLPIEALSEPIALLFERAFAPEGTRPHGRPTARNWADGLSVLAKQLTPCHRNSAHNYVKQLSVCPWCELEARSGTVFFNTVIIQNRQTSSDFKIDLVWSRITAIPSPGPVHQYSVPSHVGVQPSQKLKGYKRRRRTRRMIGWSVAIVGIILAIALPVASSGGISIGIAAVIAGFTIGRSDVEKRKSELKRTISALSAKLNTLNEVAQREATDSRFQDELATLASVRRQYMDLARSRTEKTIELEENSKRRQLHRHLEQFRIQSAPLPKLNHSRRSALQSYGIETAADISYNRVIAVPSFGPHFTSMMVSWRQELERRFVFDPNKSIDPRDILAIDRDIELTRAKLEQLLSTGEARLTNILQQIAAKRQALAVEANEIIVAVAQAQADLQAL